jgi:hypothetical protein
MGIGADTAAGYSIGIASGLLGLHARTLREYERKGLLAPLRVGNKRRYTNDELRWIRCIVELNHERGLSLDGIRRLLDFVPCWALRHGEDPPARGGDPSDPEACLRRLRRAYRGLAPSVCRTCGYYEHGMERARVAWARLAGWGSEPDVATEVRNPG